MPTSSPMTQTRIKESTARRIVALNLKRKQMANQRSREMQVRVKTETVMELCYKERNKNGGEGTERGGRRELNFL